VTTNMGPLAGTFLAIKEDRSGGLNLRQDLAFAVVGCRVGIWRWSV